MAHAKLYSSITQSSLWSETKEVRLLFISMLANCDATGFVEAALPGLARLSNLSLQETQAALLTLQSPDPESKDIHGDNPTADGRRVMKAKGGWLLVNYIAYRNRRDDENRRDYMRDYMRLYRTCKLPLATLAPVNKFPGNPGNSGAGKQCKNDEKNDPEQQMELIGEQQVSCKHSVNTVSSGKPLLAKAEAEADISTISLPVGSVEGEVPDALPEAEASPQVSSTPHQEFIAGWMENYRGRFEVDYPFDGGRDGKGVRTLLKRGKPVAELLEVAKKAWAVNSFCCERARSIHGFATSFTEIFCEVNGKNLSPGQFAGPAQSPFVQQRQLEHEKKRLEELILEHPSNPVSANHDDECPASAKDELKALRARLEIVKDLLAGRADLPQKEPTK